MDVQFDSTIDGKAIKIASMIDEHTRESLLNLAERSITAERLVAELEAVFASTGSPPQVLRMDNGPESVFQALQQVCDGRVGMSHIPPGTPRLSGHIESFNNRLRRQCLNRNHWNTLFEAQVVTGDFKDEHNHRHRSALGYRTPAEYAAARGHTNTRWPARSTESGSKHTDSNTGSISIGDSPGRLGLITQVHDLAMITDNRYAQASQIAGFVAEQVVIDRRSCCATCEVVTREVPDRIGCTAVPDVHGLRRRVGRQGARPCRCRPTLPRR